MDKHAATIQATQPRLKRYNELTQQIRQKTKARKALVAEQKNTSKLNLIKQHDLSRQITTLTEEIEELRSEKENLPLAGLHPQDCCDRYSGCVAKPSDHHRLYGGYNYDCPIGRNDRRRGRIMRTVHVADVQLLLGFCGRWYAVLQPVLGREGR